MQSQSQVASLFCGLRCFGGLGRGSAYSSGSLRFGRWVSEARDQGFNLRQYGHEGKGLRDVKCSMHSHNEGLRVLVRFFVGKKKV